MKKRLAAFAMALVVAAGIAYGLASAGSKGGASGAGATAKPDATAKSDATAAPEATLLDRSKWEARMPLPTSEQISAYEATERSPYIVCWPKFPEVTGCTEYAVDVRTDSQPRGTYVNTATWWMDVSSLEKSGFTVKSDDGLPGGGYAGFQVLEDGRKVAIMSIWKLFLTDKDGNSQELNAKRTYPNDPSIAGEFGGEGTGVQTLVDYDWQAGKTYRTLIQCGETSEGNCEVTFSVCDLETGEWTKLVAYDLGFRDTHILAAGCFLENYLPETAGAVRTVEWSNYRAKDLKTGSWVSAKAAKIGRQFKDWPGSYSFGSSDSCFWAITTGVPGLCEPPADGTEFSVTSAAEGAPE